MMPIDMEEAVKIASRTKVVKAQSKKEFATKSVKYSPKRLEEHGVIVKTMMCLKAMQHDLWQSILKRLQDEALKKSILVLDDKLSHQKLSQDKEDDWIVDIGGTKHMTVNRRLFTSYKVYDDGHVVFGSNLKGNVVGKVNFTKVDCTISKNGKTLAKGHRRNGLYTCKLGDNSKQQICLASVVDNSTL
nr:hypothetical protein [Tanacetum cinerariifolium]